MLPLTTAIEPPCGTPQGFIIAPPFTPDLFTSHFSSSSYALLSSAHPHLSPRLHPSPCVFPVFVFLTSLAPLPPPVSFAPLPRKPPRFTSSPPWPASTPMTRLQQGAMGRPSGCHPWHQALPPAQQRTRCLLPLRTPRRMLVHRRLRMLDSQMGVWSWLDQDA